MSGIDDRIVQMKFDNAQFEQGVATSVNSLDKLKKSLDFSNSKKGMDDLSNSASRFNLGNIGTTIEGANTKFLAMAALGVSALVGIASQAVSTGISIAKALTIDPMKSGFQEYSTNLNAIQTVLANTASAGTTLKDVNGALGELNTYSDKTIYNFGEMAKNIGTFTAAGVDLKTSTMSIKGIANLAALSGSNSMQASTAMYQLSQALSAGKVQLQDWNSVVNAGMGGAVFQRALAMNAEKMGTINKGALKLSGSMKNVTINGKSFRESIQAGPGKSSWLTSKVLTQTLAQFTGDLSDAKLKAEGFSAAEIKTIQAQAKTAQNAATEVKTISQAFDVAKETAQSGWAQTWQLIAGDFGQSKKTFTKFSNAFNGVINNMSAKRNNLLKGWNKLKGRDTLIRGFTQGFKALGAIIKPIQQAFRDIFPPMTAKRLVHITALFRDLMYKLTISNETAAKVRRIFAGVFAVFKIGVDIVKAIFGAFKSLGGEVGKSSGGFMDFAAKLGDWLVKVKDAIEKGQYLQKFFNGLAKVISYPIKAIQWLGAVLANFFTRKHDLSKVSDGFGRLGDRIASIKDVFKSLMDAIDKVFVKLTKQSPALTAAFNKVKEVGTKVKDALMGILKKGDFDKGLDLINTGLIAGALLIARKFVKVLSKGLNINMDVGGGLFGQVRGAFSQLTGVFKAMQANLKANVLLKIAGAIAIMTVSVIALAMVDSKKLTIAIGALSAMTANLIGSMALLNKIGGGDIKLMKLTGAMIVMATALLILSGAMKRVGEMSWDQISKGAVGLSAMVGIVITASKLVAENQTNIFAAAAGFLLIGGALNILAYALKNISMLSWKDMGKGLMGSMGAIVVIGTSMKALPKDMLGSAAALVLVAASLYMIGGVVKEMAKLSWESLGKGAAGIAGALLIIAGAMWLMPKDMLLTAAGLIVVGVALQILYKAINSMGGMSWDEIGRGLVVLAGSLLILAGGLYLMSGSIVGSLALIVAAGALALFVPVLKALGSMSWSNIIKGLVALAGTFAVIGVAALLLTPILPMILALAGAVALLGAGLGLAGLGALAFVTALTMLLAIGNMGAKKLTDIFNNLAKAMPAFFNMVTQALIGLAKSIADSAIYFAQAMYKVIDALLTAIIKIVPKALKTLQVLLDAFLRLIVWYGPRVAEAGLQLIAGILEKIAKNLKPVIDAGGDVVIAFMQGIAKKIPELVDAGLKMVIDMVNGIADAIDKNAEALGHAFGHLGSSIIEGLIKGIGAGFSDIAGVAKKLGSTLVDGVKSFLHINSPSKVFIAIGKSVNEGFIMGIAGGRQNVVDTMNKTNQMLIDAASKSADDIKKYQQKIADIKARPKTKTNGAKNAHDLAVAEAALAQAISENKKATAAQKAFAAESKKHRKELEKLGTAYDKASAKLDKYNKQLDDAKQLRDDYNKQITEQYSALPSIDSTTTLDDYFQQIRDATAANIKFQQSMDALHNLGLDDTQYKKFMEQGTSIQPLLDQLLAGGQNSVSTLNAIDQSLTTSAANLGKDASATMYQHGVDIAQGLVNGVKSEMKTLTTQMEAIGKAMAKAIKKELGIKSPSKVFAKIGKYTVEGLAKGLDQHSNVVDLSARRLGKTASDALKESLMGINTGVEANMELAPKIAPVLDLNQFRKDAVGMTDILAPNAINPSVSANNASAISTTAEAVKAAQEALQSQQTASGDKIQFIQNNNSPKALSNAEIYRQTKNQLSIVKGALK